MSDMPRPRPLPTAPDHERHDPLLVAQFVAGDTLDRDQQRLAQYLATTCGACASLVADLRAVSGAVAWEPVPPRRRDFTISELQAEGVRGGFMGRLMRRLARPQSSTLRPAAAGIMSLGLLFVVAGAAWPFDDGRVDSSGSVSGSPDVRVEALATPPIAPLDDAADGLAVPRSEPYADTIGTDAAQKASRARELETETLAQESSEMASEDMVEQSLALESVGAAAVPSSGPDAAPLEVGALVSPAIGESEAISSTADDGAGADDGVPSTADDGPEQGTAPTVASTSDGLRLESVLVALGSVLAAAGALLLVLVWLARRSADPLLR